MSIVCSCLYWPFLLNDKISRKIIIAQQRSTKIIIALSLVSISVRRLSSPMGGPPGGIDTNRRSNFFVNYNNIDEEQ